MEYNHEANGVTECICCVILPPWSWKAVDYIFLFNDDCPLHGGKHVATSRSEGVE